MCICPRDFFTTKKVRKKRTRYKKHQILLLFDLPFGKYSLRLAPTIEGVAVTSQILCISITLNKGICTIFCNAFLSRYVLLANLRYTYVCRSSSPNRKNTPFSVEFLSFLSPPFRKSALYTISIIESINIITDHFFQFFYFIFR